MVISLKPVQTFICLLIAVCAGNSQAGQFQYRQHITKEMGLPGDNVTVITQDNEGFIWIGTRTGLTRYDGSDFLTFTNNPDDSTSLVDDWISDLEIVGSELWIGTSEGISILDLNTERFTNIFLGADRKIYDVPGPNTSGAQHIYYDRTGEIWLAGREDYDFGWCRIDTTADTLVCYNVDPGTLDPSIPAPARINNVMSFYRDNAMDSILWVGTRKGMIRFNTETQEYRHLYYPVEDKSFEVSYNVFRRMWQAPDGKIYCGSWAGGLNIFDPGTEEYYPAPNPDPEYKDAFFQSIREISQKSETEIWVTLFKSLIAYDFVEQRITLRLESDFATDEIYGADFVDRDGRIWSRLHGMHIFDPGLQQFIHVSFDHLNQVGEGFTYDVVNDAERNRYTVIARDCDALYHYYHKTGHWKITPLSADVFEVNRFEGNNGIMISPDEMVISAYHKIFRYSPASETMRSLLFDFPVRVNTFHDLVPDRDGNLWFGTSDDGVFQWNPRTNQYRQFLEELGADTIHRGARVRFTDHRNNTWITRRPGVFFYSGTTGKVTELCNLNPVLCNVSEIAEDHLGRIWLNKAGMEVVILSVDNDQFLVDTILQVGTRKERLMSLHVDDNLDIWGYYGKRIARIDPVTFEMQHYNTEYLSDFNEIASAKILSGSRLVLGLANGLILIDLENLKPNIEQPVPYIAGIDVRERPYRTSVVPRQLESLDLKHNENFFSITFSALGFTLSNQNTFQFRLRDFQKDWIDADGRRFANYTNVPSGDYVFELRVFNSEGELSDEMVSLPVSIKPKWSELWYVRLTGLILLGLIIYVIYQYRVRQIMKEEKLKSEFKSQLAEVQMTALRAQMNPHFIFNCLNSIESFIIKNDTLKASTYLNDFARLIRLILQNSRSSFIPLQDELEALELYLEMESLRFAHKFNYEIDVAEDLDLSNIEVPPMVIQPYVENAIWHGLIPKGEVGNLAIRMQGEGNFLTCLIEDDGIGREQSARNKQDRGKTRNKSMGMSITKERIDILNAMHNTNTSIQIIDLKDDNGAALGTRVELKIPI